MCIAANYSHKQKLCENFGISSLYSCTWYWAAALCGHHIEIIEGQIFTMKSARISIHCSTRIKFCKGQNLFTFHQLCLLCRLSTMTWFSIYWIGACLLAYASGKITQWVLEPNSARVASKKVLPLFCLFPLMHVLVGGIVHDASWSPWLHQWW